MLNFCIEHKKVSTLGTPVELADENEFYNAQETQESIKETPPKERFSLKPAARSQRANQKKVTLFGRNTIQYG
jgi:hypothetical protein